MCNSERSSPFCSPNAARKDDAGTGSHVTTTDGPEPLSPALPLEEGDVAPYASFTGLDDFVGTWESDAPWSRGITLTAWQLVDDDHPGGSGKRAYRVVHKTLRTVTIPGVDYAVPNLHITFGNGPVNFGEPIFEGSLSRRRAGDFILPEWGEVNVSGRETTYTHEPNVRVDINNTQADTPSANYLELIYVFDKVFSNNDYLGMLTAGRSAIATLAMTLDLLFGERIVGPVLAEEVGEVFDDWHWNRLLGGRHLSLESKAELKLIDGEQVAAALTTILDSSAERDEPARTRLRVASQWYWVAEGDADHVTSFIAYWLSLEALELGENVNIAPLRARIAELLAVDEDVVREPLGRLYGLRSGLVHGVVRDATPEDVKRVRDVAVALLEYHVRGSVSETRLTNLRGLLLPRERE